MIHTASPVEWLPLPAYLFSVRPSSHGSSMLAVSITQTGIELVDMPRPRIESPDDAVLLVTTTAIGPWETASVAVSKHENTVPGAQFVGTVVELGEAVTSVEIDDLVVASAAMPKGDGHRYFGSDGLDGGHAEYVRVPEADNVLVKTTAAAEERSVFTGGAAALGIAAAHAAEVNLETRILVAGCDATVLTALASLRQSSTTKTQGVLAQDPHPARLAAAKAYGAAEIIVEDVRSGEIDTVVIGSGLSDDLLTELLNRVGHRAKFLFTNPALNLASKIGVQQATTLHWPGQEEVRKTEMEIRLKRLDLTPLVSTVLPLDEAEQAYQMALDSPPGTRSILLKP